MIYAWFAVCIGANSIAANVDALSLRKLMNEFEKSLNDLAISKRTDQIIFNKPGESEVTSIM